MLLPDLLVVIERVMLLAPLLLESSQYPDIGSVVQQLSSQFVTNASQFLTTVDSAAIQVARLAYIASFLSGILLYLTRLHRGLGSELITGGVVLAVLSEFVLPLLFRL